MIIKRGCDGLDCENYATLRVVNLDLNFCEDCFMKSGIKDSRATKLY